MRKSTIILLSICLFSPDAISTTRYDALTLSAQYLLLRWTAGADGYYEGDIVFEEGTEYTGMAYWFHPDAWDTIPLFEYKMLNHYKPREEAGIDCSGLISRCWGLSSRKVSGDFFLPNLALSREREDATPGDVLLRPGHIMLITDFTGTEDNDQAEPVNKNETTLQFS